MKPLSHKPSPSRSTVIAASWLAFVSYFSALVLAYAAYSSAKEAGDSWSGACGSMPTATYYAQYAIAGLVLGVIGLLISRAYAPRFRILGVAVILLGLLAVAASGFISSFHLCF